MEAETPSRPRPESLHGVDIVGVAERVCNSRPLSPLRREPRLYAPWSNELCVS
jgi:hypothetical protein